MTYPSTTPIYHYNSSTGEFTSADIAIESPLEAGLGIYLVPAHATTVAPDIQPGKIPVWTGEAWVNHDIPCPPQPILPTLNDIKIMAMSTLASLRKVFQYSPIIIPSMTFAELTINGVTSQNVLMSNVVFQNTESAQLKFFSLISCGCVTFPINWRLNDEITWVSLDQEQANQLCLAITSKEKSSYQQETVYINQINACTTIEEVNALTFNFQ